MQISQKDDLLLAQVRDDFAFEKCRKLLEICKTHAQFNPNARVSIELENIASFQTCAVATLSLISDWMPGGLQVNLRNCAAEVQLIFDSGMFDEYFSHNHPFITSICNSCLEYERQPASSACTQNNIHMLLNND